MVAVARVTALESLRSKVLFVAAAPIACIAAARSLLTELPVEQAARSLLEASHVSMLVFLLVGSLLISGRTLPQDIENRHLYLVFTKPLARWEYLLGKILGLWGVLVLMGVLVVAATQAALWSRGGAPRTRERTALLAPCELALGGAPMPLTWNNPGGGTSQWHLTFDLRHWFPGASYDIEISSGSTSPKRVKVISRTVTRVEVGSMQPLKGTLSLRLVAAGGSSRIKLTPRTLWLEGDSRALEESVWAGLGVDLMRILLVSAVTLAVSVSFTPGTSMLLGLTIFLVGSNRQALVELPTLLTATKEIHQHHGHEHVEHHERESFLRSALDACSRIVLGMTPDFSRRDVSAHFQKGEHLGWGHAVAELPSLLAALGVSLALGSAMAWRREFLK